MTRRQFHVALAVLCVSGLVGGFVSGLVVPGRAAWAQDVAKELRAERFVLADAAGGERAELGFGEWGEPALSLYDETGRLGATLLLPIGAPRLWLYDEAGEPRAFLGMGEGEPSLGLWDEAGNPRVDVGTMDGEPSVVLRDAAGTMRAALALRSDVPELQLCDTAGEPRATLGLDPAPAGKPTEASLRFYDAEDMPRMALSLFFGSPSLVFYDAASGFRPRMSLDLLNGAPRLSLCDGTGIERATMALLDDEPGLWLRDAAYQTRAVLGPTETEDTRTGATTRYPISTITLFDQTGRVQWQAP